MSIDIAAPPRVELTVPEAARRLRRHPQTVREYIHAGVLPAHRLGAREWRIYESDLARLRGPGSDDEERPPSVTGQYDDLASMAARIVSTWPRLSDERKAELGRLLATA